VTEVRAAEARAPEDPAAVVAWLRDRELIRAVPQRYARGVDRRDWEMVRGCFTDDCTVQGTLQTAPIDPYVEALAPGVEAYEATMHFMGNQYVEVEAGARAGYVETYAVAYHLEAPGTGLDDLFMGVRYCDDVRLDDGRWLIWRRQVFKQWHRGPLPRSASR
jgi:hypothetical protein